MLLLGHFGTSSHPLVIVGDFNFPDTQWSTLTGSGPTSLAFCEIVFDCNLSQLIKVPTHSKGHTLDLVLVLDEDLVSSVQVHPSENVPLHSDHFMITFNLTSSSVGLGTSQ